MGILGVIVHFNKLDRGLAGNLDIEILGQIILQESNKTWDFGPIERAFTTCISVRTSSLH